MATTTQTKYGQCPTHGQVAATRPMPKVQFPFVVYAVRRLAASRQPFRCPSCGDPVTV